MFSPKKRLDLTKKPLIGMVHLPSFDFITLEKTFDDVIEFSLQEAATLEKAGFDAILVENFHDAPYSKYRIDDYKYSIMNNIVNVIVKNSNIPCGVNILRNAAVQALILATVNSASFIRVNVFEGAYITDQGIIESVAKEVIQKKNEIRSQVKILADVHVKHALPFGGSGFTLEESARNALTRAKADAVIVSGRETGALVDLRELKNLTSFSGIYPILGSGLTANNLSQVFPYISGAIVGSWLKEDDLESPTDQNKAEELVNAWKSQIEKQE
ncbi:MAG: BtpA/SgcQ family protein [Candidatus Hodarchaeales archaeon]